jgi:transcriptional regulator with XRE-family HTH domain
LNCVNYKTPAGKNNLCGRTIAAVRKKLGISQRELASRLQLYGLSLDKNAVQRMESGQRFVTDIELAALAQVLEISYEELLSSPPLQEP